MLTGRRRKWLTSSVSVTLGKLAQIGFDESVFWGCAKKGCGGRGRGGPKEEGNAQGLSAGEAYSGTPCMLSDWHS